MNSSSSQFKCTSSNLKNGRLTSLANRMLGIEQPLNSNNVASTSNAVLPTTTSQQQKHQQPAVIPSIKRNLFGCRLDHDELHADLQQMLAEQRRVKSAQWSFDFETLRPMTGGRVEWRRVRVPIKPSTAGSPQQERDDEKYLMISTAESDDDEEQDEEEDEALAVPEFYKRQRRLKLAEVDKNRLNVMANNVNQNVAAQPQKPLSNSSQSSTACINLGSENQMASSKVKSTSTSTNQNLKSNAVPATPVKPRASRPSRKHTHFDQLGKILTFSENRKDTLRSASASSQRQPSVMSTFKPSANSAFTQSARKPSSNSAKSTRKTNNSKTINGQPSNDDKMRQQTLHDLEAFKQRKKRQQQQADVDAAAKVKTNLENTHFLRSHSTTVSK